MYQAFFFVRGKDFIFKKYKHMKRYAESPVKIIIA
jgi:hypothetical protein